MWLVSSWGVAHNKFKGGFGGSGIGPGIMYILSKWEPLVPSGLAVVDEDVEVLFKPLIRAFGLAVSLGVVGGAYVLFDIEDAAKFLWEVRSEAGILVSDDLAGGTIVRKNMLDVEIGNGGGGGRFMAGNKNSSFRAVVVRNSEDAVKAIGKWEFNNEVHGNGCKWEGGAVGGNGTVRDAGARGIDLGGLTGGTTMDEGGDEVLHVGPPVIFGKEKASFEDARVARSGGIMV